jgi:DNA-binding Lrp family transcriptional regulator
MIDRKIFSRLQLNGRTTFKDLGELVGYTSMGIKKRLENLQERDIIKVSALLNIRPLNLSAAIVLLEIESAKLFFSGSCKLLVRILVKVSPVEETPIIWSCLFT